MDTSLASDGLDGARGMLNGVAFSLVLWALILAPWLLSARQASLASPPVDIPSISAARHP